MPAAQKRVKILADLVGSRGGARADDTAPRTLVRIERPVDAEQLLSHIRERAKALPEASVAPGTAPPGKLNAVPIDRPGPAAETKLLETKRPQAKKSHDSRKTAERAARMTNAPKAASSVENMLYRKGAATAATFRPAYWSFDVDAGAPPAEAAPRDRQAETRTPRSRSPRSR